MYLYQPLNTYDRRDAGNTSERLKETAKRISYVMVSNVQGWKSKKNDDFTIWLYNQDKKASFDVISTKVMFQHKVGNSADC